MNSLKDPVCGMNVVPKEAQVALYGNQRFYFRSDICRGRRHAGSIFIDHNAIPRVVYLQDPL